MAVILALLAPTEDVLLSCDFEQPDWYRAWGENKVPVHTELIEGKEAFGGRGKSLKVTVPKGDHMGTSFYYKFRERTGSEPEEMYFRYHVKFDPDWKNATFGGKMPGFGGTYGKAGWGGRKVNGTDGWSARGHFDHPSADTVSIGFYCYHVEQKTKFGDMWDFKPNLKYGVWYCVDEYCKLNTPTKKDGILRGWIDGQLAFERTDIRFRDVDTLKIEDIWVNVYHGGATPVPKEDIHLYLDNIVISRKPISKEKQ